MADEHIQITNRQGFNWNALSGGLNLHQFEEAGSEEFPRSRLHGSGLVHTSAGMIPVHVQLLAVKRSDDGVQEVLDPFFAEDWDGLCLVDAGGGPFMHVHYGEYDYVLTVWPHSG